MIMVMDFESFILSSLEDRENLQGPLKGIHLAHTDFLIFLLNGDGDLSSQGMGFCVDWPGFDSCLYD